MRSRHTDCVFFAVQRGPRRKVPRGKRRRSSFFTKWAYLSVFYRSWHGQICRLEAEGRTAGADIPAYLACLSVYLYIALTSVYPAFATHGIAFRRPYDRTASLCFLSPDLLPAPSFCNLPGACLFCACGRHCFFAVHPRPFTPRPTFSAAPDASRVRRRNGRGAGRGMDGL